MEGEVPGWGAQQSPLWEEGVRAAVCREREEDSVINRLRGAALVPGTPLHLGAREARLPVLVVRRGGAWGAGFDVICPGGWGAALWHCLVLTRGRVGGLGFTAAALPYKIEATIITLVRAKCVH